MHISAEGVLRQLGYNSDENTLRQFEAIAKNTPGFDQIQKHIIALHDHLKNYGGFVAMSNSVNHLKIKIDTTEASMIEAAKEEIERWAQKYNVNLQKVPNKETYYILGIYK